MNEMYLKEKANALHNEMNQMWTGILVTTGGAIGFSVFEEKTALVIIYIILGVFFAIIFLNGYMIRRQQLKQIVEDLSKLGGKNGNNL